MDLCFHARTPSPRFNGGKDRYPATPTPSQISTSFMPTLYPYLSSGPSSRSSQDITSHPISQESDSPHRSSLQYLPATSPVPATRSVPHLPALPPSPNLNSSGLLASTNSSTQNITSHPISEESYSLHSLSTFYTTAATVSLQNLPPLPPSPNLGPGGYSPSINSSVVGLPEPGTERLDQPRHSSSSSSSSSSSPGVSCDIGVTSPPCLSEAHPRIFPGTPESVRRYTQQTIIPNEPATFSLPPLTISVLPNPPPPGWTTCHHPEGAQYFFHEETRVFTDANLFDNDTFVFVDHTIHTVHDFLRCHNTIL
ncbi:hypothetical protein B0H11DRAFT_2306759 [Mycena galericulata]|nr:hypothetical protein B0H11DRAFT_2306759 [Mycena galericulata]